MSFGSAKMETVETRLSGVQINQSTYGVGIGTVWGTHRVPSNMLWYGDFRAIPHTQKSGGGKGGGAQMSSTTFTYQAAFVLALGTGEVDGVGKVWVDKEIKSLAALGFTLKSGALGQPVWAHLAGQHPDEAIGYSGIAYVCTPTFELGRSTRLPNLNFELRGKRVGPDGCARPRHIISDIVSDPVDGLGLPATLFDAASMADFDLWCTANDITLSLAAQEQREAREYLADVLRASMAAAVPSAGRIRIVPYGDEPVGDWAPVTTAAYEIGEGDLIGPPRLRRRQNAEATNRITLKYADAQNDYNTVPVTRDDISMVNRYGVKPETLDLKLITRGSLAEKVCDFWLARKLYIRNEIEFEVDERFLLLEPMDLVTLTFGVADLAQVPLRVKEVEENDGVITVVAEEWPYGVVKGITVPSENAAGYVPNLNVDPGNSSAPVIFEPPIALAGAPQIWLATSGGQTWGGCEVWISLDDATYERIGDLRAPARHGLLTAPLAAAGDPDMTSQVRVDLSVSGAQLVSATQDARDLFETACWVDGEIISYQTAQLTASHAYQLSSLRRGAFGTSIAGHAPGAKFVRLDEAVFRHPIPTHYIGRTLYIKLASFNRFGSRTQDLADLIPTPYTVVGAPLGGVAGLALERPWTGRTLAATWLPYQGPLGAYVYRVEVWSGGVKRRTVETAAPRFEATIEQLVADGCTRTLELRVFAVSDSGVSSAPSVLGVSNAPPPAPAVSLYDQVEAIGIVTAPPVHDDYVRTRFWVSQSAGINVAEMPPSHEGTATDWTTAKLAPGTWYVRAAHVDQFGSDVINASAETSIVVTSAASGVPRVANAAAVTAPAGSPPPGGDAYLAVWSLLHGTLWSWDAATGRYLNNADLSNAHYNLLTAMRASVGYLSALSGSMGNLQIDANGWLRTNGVTGFSGGAAGIFAGHDAGKYKFRAGSATNMMGWDGTKAIIGNPSGARVESEGGGIVIYAADGSVLLASGSGVPWDKIAGVGKPADGATRNVFRGDWIASTSYAVGDIVLKGGNGWSCILAHTSASGNQPPASGSGNTWWAPYAVKGSDGAPGQSALTVLTPNNAHTLPASSAGVVASYVGSGTTIQVFEGATALSAVSSITAPGQFTLGTPTQSPASTITVGARSYSDTTATVAQHSAMATGTDSVVITYPITVRRLDGTTVTISTSQTITKSKAGAAGAPGLQGPAGPAVVVTASRALTFTATDGALDGSQTNIVLTAAVSGISSPTYAWTFSGFQTVPTASTTGSQTITAAQFGTSKSAVVTCTVNGTYKDQVTIVRLEKSTAEANATKGATFDAGQPGTIAGKITESNVTSYIDNAAFGNAQIGGDIWSSNYVGGNSGWRVYRSGNAEFHDIVARGDIEATSLKTGVAMVDTLNVAGDAITAPTSGATAALYMREKALASYTNSRTIGTVVTSAHGRGLVSIQLATNQREFIATVNNASDYATAFSAIRLKRNGVVILEVSKTQGPHTIYAYPILLTDNPGAGVSCTYSLETYTYRGSGSAQPYHTHDISPLYFLLMEYKR